MRTLALLAFLTCLCACQRPVQPARAGDAGVAGPPAIVDAGARPAAAPVVDAGVGAVEASTRTITVNGPRTLTWKTIDGNHAGPGEVRVRASATSITAVDSRWAATHDVPIKGGVADWDTLPRSALAVSVPSEKEGAVVFLGTESLGRTPVTKSVRVGDYIVKLVAGTETRTARVTVEEGKTATVRVHMGR